MDKKQKNNPKKSSQKSKNTKSVGDTRNVRPVSPVQQKPVQHKSGATATQTSVNKSKNIPKQTKPLDKRTRKAAQKAMNTRHNVDNHRKFKGGNYVLYYVLFAFLAIIVLIVLANTVLFNCTEIVVNGVNRYTADTIVEISRIRHGDNLLHIDKTKAEQKITDGLTYVDKAKVRCSFPTKIVIDIVESEKYFCVSQYGVNALISEGGKILEKGIYTDVPIVYGYEAKSLETGTKLTSKDEDKQDIPDELLTLSKKIGINTIDMIDMTDRYDISIHIDGRIILEIGSMSSIETKLMVAHKIIETEISPTENVTINVSNPEKVAVHNNDLDFVPENNDDSNTDSADNSTQSTDNV